MNRYLKNCMAFMVIGICTMCSSAYGYVEIPDAGQSLGTAQIVPNGTNVIQGSLTTDADLYLFGWAGGNIEVLSKFVTGAQLFLFSIDGTGILANDNALVGGFIDARIVTTLSAGSYYLGISRNNLDPYDSNNNLIFPDLATGVNGPLSSNPLDHWFGGTGSGGYNYVIEIHPATATVAVPEPGTLVLLGSFLVGVMCRKRKIKIEKMDS